MKELYHILGNASIFLRKYTIAIIFIFVPEVRTGLQRFIIGIFPKTAGAPRKGIKLPVQLQNDIRAYPDIIVTLMDRR
jgi:hypothetical protein